MERKYELIEKYLLDEMSVGEQIEFEDLLRNDPDLMQEYLLRSEINNAIQEEEVISLRDSLGEIVNEESSSTIQLKKSIIYASVAAIAFLIVVVASNSLLPLKKQIDSDIFHSYYSVYPSASSFRSKVNRNEIEEIFHNAFKNYDEGNYAKASELFDMVNTIESSNIISHFYVSICEIENNNFQKANILLKELILNENHIFVEQACWYFALVLIEQKEFDEAREILSKIVDEKMYKKTEAKEILEILDIP